MTEYTEGIYFNMPEEEYHDIPYFSRSMAEKINMDLEEAWHSSYLNPENTDIRTPAMQLGSAVHSMLLEPEIFEALYAARPSYSDFKGLDILDKNADLQAFLAAVGEKKTGKKEELIARAEPYIDPSRQVIWDNVMKSFHDEIDKHGKREISHADLEILTGIKKQIDDSKKIKKILQDGYPEVTIILKDEDTGTMCKYRLDYVRSEAIGEVKTFSIKHRKSIMKSMCDAINNERYNMQFAVYQSALEQAINKINTKNADVFGDVDSQWLEQFLKTPIKQFFIVFARTQAPYQIKAIELKKSFSNGGNDNIYYSEGLNAFKMAIKKYSEYINKFGSERWTNLNEVEVLSDEHVPHIIYQNPNY